ncbi:MAG: diguanylate cyclase [Candidatus Kuenenia sp.]|nr:diguanylate cyclase [Candidatus Kuenenia hertensis]
MKKVQNAIETKKKLVAMQIKHKHLHDHSPIGILVLNDKGIIIEANRTIARKLSLRKTDILKQSIFNFIDVREKETFFLHMKKVFTNQNTSSKPIKIQLKGRAGTTLCTQVKSVPLRETRFQNPILCQSFFSDITLWKQIENEKECFREQKEKGLKYLEYLKCFSTLVNKDIREEKLLKQAATILKSHFQPDVLAMLLLDKHKYLFESFFVLPSIHMNKLFKHKVLLNPSICCVMRAGKELIVKDVRRDSPCECLQYKIKEGGYACIPLTGNNIILGMILIIKKEKYYWNREENYKYLSIYANLIAAAMHRTNLTDYSNYSDVIDEHTGIYNKRFFDQILEKQANIAMKNKKPLSIIIINIHEFDSLCYAYGNNVGKQVMRKIIYLITKNTRTSDVIARYSENAIGIILPTMGIGDVVKKADIIKQTIESFAFKNIVKGENIKVTTSSGFATLPDHASDPNILAGIASIELYKTRKNQAPPIFIP